MSLALYRKHRSATFADLVGQEHVATTLRNQVRTGQVAHAYLFAGIRGTGKTSSARILARAVVCLALRDGEPCNRCSACDEVLSGRAVDVLEIDAASNRGIDEMRELRERVKFLPASLRRKVYIVDEAHMLTTEAWNAFLKTLEEPPDHVLFVLATTEPHKVPETVRSRVQRFDFHRVEVADLAPHLAAVCGLEGVEADADALALVAVAGQGSVRDALSVLDQALAGGESPLTATAVRRALGLADPAHLAAVLRALAAGDAAGALRGIAAAFEGGGDARQLLREMARLARAAEMVAVGYADGAEVTGGDVALAAELAGQAPSGLWVDAIDRFAEAEVNLRQPVDARLQVELALLRLARRGAPSGLAARVAELERMVGHGGAAPPASLPPPAAAAATPAAASSPPAAAIPPGAPAAVSIPPPPAAVATPAAASTPPSPAAATAPASAPVLLAVAPPDSRPAAVGGTPTPAPVDAAQGARSLPAGSAPAPGQVSADTPDAPEAELAGNAPPPSSPPAGGDAGLAAWQEAFPLIIEALGRRDPMLGGVLRSCRPIEGTAERLVIGAPYGFHLERLRDRQKAPALAEAVAAVAGTAVAVEVVFAGDDEERPAGRAEGRADPAVPVPASAGDAVDPTQVILATFPGSRVTGSVLRERGPLAFEAPGRPVD